jgi:hypothetical protein
VPDNEPDVVEPEEDEYPGTRWEDYFQRDGSVVIPLADGQVTLRIPKFGELKTIRRSARDDRKLAKPRTDRLRELVKLTQEEGAKDEPDLDTLADYRSEIADLSDEQTGALLDWYAKVVIQTLGDRNGAEPLSGDDLPAWLSDAEFTRRLNVQWATTPRVPGG